MSESLSQLAKPVVTGIVIGAVAVLVVEFATGWVVTSGTAKEMAVNKADDAVVSSLTPICIDQFKNEKDKKTLLEALEKQSFWLRGDFVEEHGWATMPGSNRPNNQVASECANELVELDQKTK
jgi:hypothetical protein